MQSEDPRAFYKSLFVGEPPPPLVKAQGTEVGLAGFTADFEPSGTTNPTTVGNIRFRLTPARNLWFWVQYHIILINTVDVTWVRADARVDLFDGTGLSVIADAAGWTNGPNVIIPSTNGVGWQSITPEMTFKLVANQSYLIRPLVITTSGTWQYWRGGTHLGAISEVVGFW